MKLIIGLGNPGKKYDKTRHNAGFMALDYCRQKNDFSGWRLDKKFNALLAEGEIGGEKMILAKPQTFMNESGRAVRAVADYYKVKPADIWVIHDDLDIPLGKLKIKKTGSSAGHKGVQSIIDYLKTPDFNRLRIGIKPLGGPASSAGRQKEKSENLVLKKFGLLEKNKIKASIQSAMEAIKKIIIL